MAEIIQFKCCFVCTTWNGEYIWMSFPCFVSVVCVQLDLLFCKLFCDASTIAILPTLQSIVNVIVNGCLAFVLPLQ